MIIVPIHALANEVWFPLSVLCNHSTEITSQSITNVSSVSWEVVALNSGSITTG